MRQDHNRFDPRHDCRHAYRCSSLEGWDCGRGCIFVRWSDEEWVEKGPLPKLQRLGMTGLVFRPKPTKTLDTESGQR